MRRFSLLILGLSLVLTACLPTIFPTPAPPVDLQASAQVFVQQTLDSLATPTIVPTHSATATITTAAATATRTQGTATETQNPILLTLTATLGTGTATARGTTTAGTYYPLAFTSTPSATRNPFILTPSGTPHAQFYGTLPPYVPSGKIILVNKSKAEAYISLQVTTTEGLKSILEYPVKGTVISIAPAGKYLFVAWVGGKKMIGSFRLGKDEDLTLTLLKDKVVVGKQ